MQMTQEQRPLRIGYVVEGVYDEAGGISSYVDVLGDYFTNRGHEVSIIAAESSVDDPRVRSLGRAAMVALNGSQFGISLPLSRERADKLASELRLDVAHVQVPEAPWFGVRLVKSIKTANPNTALIATSHSVPGTRPAALVGGLLGRASQLGLYRHTSFDEIISVSMPARDYVKSAFNLESTITPCPVDVGSFREGRRIEAYGTDKTNIVFLGRLVERKGCAYLLNALGSFPPEMLEGVRVLIGGDGPDRAKLEERARGLGLSEAVQFLGRISPKDKPDFLASADIAVFPSTGGESFGIILVEAMAARAGVVVGGDNIGYQQVLSSTPNALVDPRDRNAFAQTLRNLITDKNQRAMFHSAQQDIVGQYDISVVGQALEATYREVLARRRAA
jgi:phosphatidylinositol alpha-mannosyltransferase